MIFWRTRDLGYFLESIMMLEFGLAIRSDELFSNDNLSDGRREDEHLLSHLADCMVHE
ncbi:hypothetical protein OROGR_027752 [Orobanche gracilis]